MGCGRCDHVDEYRIKHEYDDKGRVTKESDWTIEGHLIRYGEFVYDSTGNRIEEREYSSGLLEHKDIHVYDTDANKTTTTRYGPDGKVQSKWGYRYDASRNLIEIISYLSGSSVSAKQCYRYDHAGKCNRRNPLR